MAEPTDHDGIAGRIALVTGAAGDIGGAIAVELARRRATVVVADLEAAGEGLRATADRCRDAAATGVELALFDVADADDVEAALDGIVERVGVPQLLVNNAGVQGAFANVVDADVDDARRVLEVNALGPLLVTRAFGRRLRAAGLPGAVVNIASMAWHGAPNMPAYSMSKAAVVGLTRASARDLAPFDIRVNSVSPAFIGPGAMWDRQVALQAETPSPYYADDPVLVAEQMIGQVPMRRYGSVEEVASVVAFLLSRDAAYLTGSDVEVAGGAS